MSQQREMIALRSRGSARQCHQGNKPTIAGVFRGWKTAQVENFGVGLDGCDRKPFDERHPIGKTGFRWFNWH